MQRRQLALAGFLAFACRSDHRKAAPAHFTGPAPRTLIQLDQLNLQAEVPAGTRLHRSPTAPIYDLILPGDVYVTVIEAHGEGARSLEMAKLAAVQGRSATDVQTESLSDGWVIRFTDPAPEHTHWIQVMRALGDQAYVCMATDFRPEDAAPILSTCKSLRR